MPAYITLLRAVNLGGASTVDMGRLRDVLSNAGFEGVRTWLNSCNVVFASPDSDAVRVERKVEERVRRDLGTVTEAFVRSAAQWNKAIANNPLRREALGDPAHLLLNTLRDSPSSVRWKSLAEAVRGRELVRSGGRHAYFYFPDGIGRSKLTPALIERHLGTRGTMRNWNTVLKLAAMAADGAPAAFRAH